MDAEFGSNAVAKTRLNSALRRDRPAGVLLRAARNVVDARVLFLRRIPVEYQLNLLFRAELALHGFCPLGKRRLAGESKEARVDDLLMIGLFDHLDIRDLSRCGENHLKGHGRGVFRLRKLFSAVFPRGRDLHDEITQIVALAMKSRRCSKGAADGFLF